MKKQTKQSKVKMMPGSASARESAMSTLKAFAPNTWWLAHSDKYYFKDTDINNPDPRFVEYSEKLLRIILKNRGIFSKIVFGSLAEGKRFQDWLWGVFIDGIVTRQVIRWAGELAGWQPGIHDLNGHRILVDQGPDLLDISPGDYADLEAFVQQLLPDGQADYFKSWVKKFATQLYELRDPIDFQPTQILFIGGAVDIGKTLLATGILRAAFGGRISDATNALLDVGAWNTSQSRAELALCDDMGKPKRFSKEEYNSLLKKWGSGNQSQVRTRFKDETEARLLRALVVLLNTQSISLSLLPDDTGDIADKLIVLKACKTDFALGSEKVCKALIAQTGAWLEYLLYHYEIPAEVACEGRFGIKAYRHEELAEAQQENSKLEVIEKAIFLLRSGLNERKEYTTFDLLIEIKNLGEFSSSRGMWEEVKNLTTTALGMHLHTIVKDDEKEVEKRVIFVGRKREKGSKTRAFWALLPLGAAASSKGAAAAKKNNINEIR
jgi:hypothetical protein